MTQDLLNDARRFLNYKMSITQCRHDPERAQELYAAFKWWQKGGTQGYDEFAAWMQQHAPDEWHHINECPLYEKCPHTLTRAQTIEYFKALLKIAPFYARALNHVVRVTPQEMGLKEKKWEDDLEITELD